MNEDQFDKCPNCGSFRIFGLRCHPKFSVKAGIQYRKEDGGDPDLVAFYAHHLPELKVLIDALECNKHDVISVEEWKDRGDGTMWWVEIYP